jgi:hypothetical protein
MVFDAHDRAFTLFKGTCSRGIYDNTKTGGDDLRRQGSAIPASSDESSATLKPRRAKRSKLNADMGSNFDTSHANHSLAGPKSRRSSIGNHHE